MHWEYLDYCAWEEEPKYVHKQNRSLKMEIVTGQVEEIKENKRFKVFGEWYGSFNAVPGISIGDFVTLNWAPDKTGQYKNIKGISKVDAPAGGAAPPAPSGAVTISATNREHTIIRQNALAHATALVVAAGVSGDVYQAQDLVIDLAKKYAKYSETGVAEAQLPVDDFGDNPTF